MYNDKVGNHMLVYQRARSKNLHSNDDRQQIHYNDSGPRSSETYRYARRNAAKLKYRENRIRKF